MKLQVTQKHINRAIKAISQDPRLLPSRDCPVAQCLREAFPGRTIQVAFTDAIIDNVCYRLREAEQYTRLYSGFWHTATPGEIEVAGLN